MVQLQPCGIVLLVITAVILLTWVAAHSWSRGFTLAWEGCQLGAFDDSGSAESNTYSEGLAYASKNPPLTTAIKQATVARAASKAEGFVYRNTDMPLGVDGRQYRRQEGFTRLDYVLPGQQWPGQVAATATSPFVGHL